MEMMVVSDGWFNGVRENLHTAPVDNVQDPLTPQKTPIGTKQELQQGAKGEDAANKGVVIVAAVLPLVITRKANGFDIEWDYRKAAAKLRNPKCNFKFVGWVGLEVPDAEQAALTARLVSEFGCYPIYLDLQLAYR